MFVQVCQSTDIEFEKPKTIYKRRPFMRVWYLMMRLVLVPLQRSMAVPIPVNDGAVVTLADDGLGAELYADSKAGHSLAAVGCADRCQ